MKNYTFQNMKMPQWFTAFKTNQVIFKNEYHRISHQVDTLKLKTI